MEVEIANEELERIDADEDHIGRYSKAICKAFRKKMDILRSIADERELVRLRSLASEKYKDHRKGQFSIRVNDQFRLFFRVERKHGGNILRILDMRDEH